MPKRSMNPIDAHVGARVRLRRMLIGMSQEKLGEMLGVTFQQIQKYEKGANRIGASRLYEVSRILDVPVQFFFDDLPDDGDRPIARPHGFSENGGEPFVMDFVSSSEGLSLNRAYTGIKDGKIRRGILDLVRSIAGTGEEDDAAA
jgi:transcriptional regulator with XRE-family HTH domain